MNLSSVYSKLGLYSDEIQQRFRDPRGLKDLENLIANYQVSQLEPNFRHESFGRTDAEIFLGVRE